MTPPEPSDLLDLPLREILARLITPTGPHEADPWLRVDHDIRRHVLGDAERGFVEVSRVGRKLFWRRSQRDRWYESRRISPKQRSSTPDPEVSADHIEQLLAAGGYRRIGKRTP